MKDKFIEALIELKLKPIDDFNDLEIRKKEVINTLIRIYGEGGTQINQIKEIQFKRIPSIKKSKIEDKNNLEDCIKILFNLMDYFISEIKRFGIPEILNQKSSNDLNINLSQKQINNQEVKIIIDFIQDTFKTELSQQHLKEIKDIVKSTESKETKKKKLAEKFKSFGENIVSNILANIFLNPSIITGFF